MRKSKKVIIIAIVIIAAVLLFLGYCFYKAIKELDGLDLEQPVIEQTQLPVDILQSPDTSATQSLVPTITKDQHETPQPEPTSVSQSVVPNVTSSIDLGYLTIKGKKVRVLNSISEDMLKKAPCWVETSALPGEEGMCLIYGHRNRTHLRVLKDVVVGDDILFTYPDGRIAEYVVSEIIIHEQTSDWTHPVVDGDSLVLVTCWPFVYSGSAPGKAVVVGKLKQGSIGAIINVNRLSI